jgi:hypothetical protein
VDPDDQAPPAQSYEPSRKARPVSREDAPPADAPSYEPSRKAQPVSREDAAPADAPSYEPSHKARTVSREDAAPADTPSENRPYPGTSESHGSSGTTTPVHAVSLRDGPSGGSSIIGTLRPGTPLEVLGTSNGWVQVRSSVGTGWAYGSYLAGGARAFASASANDGASGPARASDGATSPVHASDGASSPAHEKEVASAPAGKPSAAANSAKKPPGTANPALAGGGPPLSTSKSAETSHGGLASQINSP